MSEHQLSVFNFENKPLRAVNLDGEVWVAGVDVCNMLELANSRQSLSSLDDDERLTVTAADAQALAGQLGLGKPGQGPQSMILVNESGVYTLVFRSNKPEAKRIRKWITSEVMPTLRKTGKYAMPGSGACAEAKPNHIETPDCEPVVQQPGSHYLVPAKPGETATHASITMSALNELLHENRKYHKLAFQLVRCFGSQMPEDVLRSYFDALE